MNLDDLIARCTEAPDERWDICAELYSALDSHTAEPVDLAPFASSFASFWRDVDEQVRPFQQDEGHSWRWAEDYQDPRNEALLLLDILGYVPGPEVIAELQRALTLSDQRLLMFAALSLLRQGTVLPQGTIAAIAACDETRNLFSQFLEQLGKGDLFPPEYAHPEPRARSEMVSWLTSPAESECAPDEIDLMDVFEGDLYVYRFRMSAAHIPGNKGWVAGIAGRITYSDFEPADSTTAEEHAWRMLLKASR
jgi:hypothetical protein